MPEVIRRVRHLRNFTISGDRNLSVRYEGGKRWQSSFHKGRFTTAVLPTDYGPVIPVLSRDGACKWPAMHVEEGSVS
jgi:hypothetical protein